VSFEIKGATVKTLLVLEDEPALMKFLRHTLVQHNLLEASTAEQALHLFATHGRRVDLLLADVTLPTSSGLRVAFFLRSELPTLPVILTSGYPVSSWNARDSVDLHRLGKKSVRFIQKPFQAQALSSLVQELLGTSSPGVGRAQGENS
jgi:DNA-binding NtrC family response regulator